MPLTLRRAGAEDLGDLLELMHEFYGEAGYSLNPDRARAAFLPLLTPWRAGAGVVSRD